MFLETIKCATVKDATLQEVAIRIRSVQWKGSCPTGVDAAAMSSFHNIKGELTLLPPDNDLNLRGKRLVIPHTLQTRTLAIAYEGHQSLVGTKQQLREKCVPQTLTTKPRLLKSCLPCEAITPTKTAHQQPLNLSELPPGPRLHVSSVSVVQHLMRNISSSSCMDENSLYSLVDVECSTSATVMISELDKMFCLLVSKPEK